MVKYPKGYKSAPGYTKIAVSMPDELFKNILKMARKEHKTFNVMVLDLIRCGKLDLDESDKHRAGITNNHKFWSGITPPE